MQAGEKKWIFRHEIACPAPNIGLKGGDLLQNKAPLNVINLSSVFIARMINNKLMTAGRRKSGCGQQPRKRGLKVPVFILGFDSFSHHIGRS